MVFFFSAKRPDRLWSCPLLLFIGYRRIFPRAQKGRGREPNYLLSSIVQILALWYVFMKCTGRNLFLNMLQPPAMLSELLTTSRCPVARHNEVN